MQNFMDRMNQLFTVINQIGTTVDGISLELKQIQSKMERLEETNDRNNLRLLDRINNVESLLLEIKESNSSIATSRYPSGSMWDLQIIIIISLQQLKFLRLKIFESNILLEP